MQYPRLRDLPPEERLRVSQAMIEYLTDYLAEQLLDGIEIPPIKAPPVAKRANGRENGTGGNR